MPDVRLEQTGASVNDQLLDRAIRHLVFLQRLKPGMRREILEILDKADEELTRKIERQLSRLTPGDIIRFSRGVATTQRAVALRDTIRAILQESKRLFLSESVPRLRELSAFESEFEFRLLSSTVALDLDFVSPSPELLKTVVTARPMDGAILRDWADRYGVGKRRRVNSEIVQGMIQGETSQEIIRRVKGTAGFEGSRRFAATIVNTAIQHTAAAAREEVWKANSDVIKSIRYVATLDSRTTFICRDLDGTVWPVGEGPRPPQHPNCRSSTSAITKSWRELGFDKDDLSPDLRASHNGAVPAEITYDQWLEGSSRQTQLDALGATRFELWREGNLKDSGRFVDPTGQPWTLDKLKTREADVFERAGL